MLDAIKALHPFRDMEGVALAAAVRHASWIKLPAGRSLGRPGEAPARELYLVAGTVLGVAAGNQRRLNAKNANGQALSAHFERGTALTTATAATLIAVDLAALRPLLSAKQPGAPSVAAIEDWMHALLRGPVMRWFSPGAWAQVLRRGQMRTVSAGERVVRKGEVCDTVYVVARGAAVAADVRLGPGDFFGEESTLSQQPARCDVTMTQDGALVCFARRDLLALAANYEPPRLSPPPRRIDLDGIAPAQEGSLLATLTPGPPLAVRCSDPARRLTVATRLMRQGFHVV